MTPTHPILRLSRVLLLALTLGAFSSLAVADDAGEKKPVTIPFALLKTQHMTVKVKINGKGPYRLIFDTGAPVTLINNKVAKEAGVFPKNFRQPLFAFFGSMGKFTMQSLEVGDLKVKNVNTIVMDHPTVAAISNALGPIEGILGFNFFAKYRMTIDYQAKTMTFVPTDFQPPDMLEKMEDLIKTMVLGQSKESKKVLAAGGLLGFKIHKDKDDEDPGVSVKFVYADSPAARAGIKEGDRLLTLDGRWTDTPVDCHAAAARLAPGTPVHAVILRDGKEMELTVEMRPGL